MVLKYNTKGEDHGKNSAGGWTEPRNNQTLVCKLVKLEEAESSNKNQMLKVVAEVVEDGPHKGFRGYDNVMFMDSTKWKVDQFLQAVGVDTAAQEEGTFHPKKHIGTLVKVRFKDESRTITNDDGAAEVVTRAKPAGYYRYSGPDLDEGPFGSDADLAAEGEEDFEVEVTEEGTWAEVGAAADQGDEESVAALTEAAEANSVDPDDFETWELLGEYLDGNGEDNPEEDEEEESEEEEEGDVLDYSEWDLPALQDECKTRGLNTKGTRAVLVSRLEKHDADNPFDE